MGASLTSTKRLVHTTQTAYAHSLAGRPRAEWETLSRHLDEVAARAGRFAAAFGAAEWGALAGAWHDLGKLSHEFQRYIGFRSDADDAGEEDAVPGRVDHSTFGAQYAVRTLGREKHAAWILAYCIAGHHAGLADGSADDETVRRSSLLARLGAQVPDVQYEAQIVSVPRFPFAPSEDGVGFQVAFFTRMLFSCLVDADRLATEAFCQEHVAFERDRPKPSLLELEVALDQHVTSLQKRSDQGRVVNQVRAEVQDSCITASGLEPGFFTLNVPTGGGKTLASLRFALRHALKHDLRRVVMAIPYTSIIEQTAAVYREALGTLADTALLEHHSTVDPTSRTRENKLAVENWDAPLVVTTNVQLLESLFAARTTPCRKLHRLAGSVIVLDEAQMLPVELLHPTLHALKELVRNYRCSVVLCTATQPALEQREGFSIGIRGSRSIVPNPTTLFDRLGRVEVHSLGKLSDEMLSERLSTESQALCIVNTRAHAARLYDMVVSLVGRDGTFHLSTSMCAEHRRQTLTTIRDRLKREVSCRVVSTQLIEAGVDVDFPVVFRAPAGFDSIAQAAGRCNREGKSEKGLVYLFETDVLPPAGMLRQTAQITRELFPVPHPDPLRPEAVEAYFRHFYWSQTHSWDKHGVLPQFNDSLRKPELLLKFRSAATLYRLIRDEQTSVLVPFNKTADDLIARLQLGESTDYSLFRAIQPYLVGIWPNTRRDLLAREVLVEHECGIFILQSRAAYDADRGLTVAGVGIDAESLYM